MTIPEPDSPSTALPADDAPEPVPGPEVPDGWPSWIAEALQSLHDRLVKLGG